MKRNTRRVLLPLMMMLLFTASLCYGSADVVTQTVSRDKENKTKIITITATDNGGDGILYQLTGENNSWTTFNGWITKIETDPDAVAAPTDNYDIALLNASGADILIGDLANRDSTTSEIVDGMAHQIKGRPVLQITGNTANPATVVITIYIWTEGM